MAARSRKQAESAGASGRIAGQCLAVRARILGRVVTSIYDDALRPFGVTVGQINVLVTVNTLRGADPAGPTQSAVGAVLFMEKSTLSRNVERLVRDGMLMGTAGADGRSRLLAVTTRGKRLIERVLPAWEVAQRRAQELLGRDGERALRASTDGLWKRLPT